MRKSNPSSVAMPKMTRGRVIRDCHHLSTIARAHGRVKAKRCCRSSTYERPRPRLRVPSRPPSGSSRRDRHSSLSAIFRHRDGRGVGVWGAGYGGVGAWGVGGRERVQSMLRAACPSPHVPYTPTTPTHPTTLLFNTTAPSGGSVSAMEWAKPCEGMGSAVAAAAQRHARAAVLRQVGVDDFAPVPGLRDADAIAVADQRRPVHDGDDGLIGVGAGALKGDDAVFVIAAVDPPEARRRRSRCS